MAPDVPSKESSRNSQVGPSSIVKIQLPKTQAAVAIPANSDKKHQKPDKPEPMIAYLGGGGSSGVALPGGGTESSQLGYTLLASRVWWTLVPDSINPRDEPIKTRNDDAD